MIYGKWDLSKDKDVGGKLKECVATYGIMDRHPSKLPPEMLIDVTITITLMPSGYTKYINLTGYHILEWIYIKNSETMGQEL